jgi:hypothetical protein
MNTKTHSFASIALPFMGALIVFTILIIVDQISGRFGLTGWQRIGDNVLGGVLVGILLFLDQRRRDRYLKERLETIGSMNHHVRNALQAIKYARYSEDDVRVIEDSVARIEWALREILPGGEHQASSAPVPAPLPATFHRQESQPRKT